MRGVVWRTSTIAGAVASTTASAVGAVGAVAGVLAALTLQIVPGRSERFLGVGLLELPR